MFELLTSGRDKLQTSGEPRKVKRLRADGRILQAGGCVCNLLE